MGEHPRALNSGLIPCANCGHRLADSAPFCPECTYPWPRARDRNRVICPACDRSVAVYVRRAPSRVNRWDRTPLCAHCGIPDPWQGQAVEARQEPPPTLQERLIGIGVLVIVGVIISYVLG